MNRTAFLVDGFNLYHSVKQASRELALGGSGTRWLNIDTLCRSYLYVIGNEAQISGVYYFSALAKHLEAISPEVTKRHLSYIECLISTGIIVELSRFKKKRIECDTCHSIIKRHEEKETDVAISVKLFELFLLDACDTVVLVTGDTDLAPAVRTAQQIFPAKQICFAFPYGRKNKELAALVPTSFLIDKESYVNHQFPNPVVLADGRVINKPATW